jgi:hypothetical protein
MPRSFPYERQFNYEDPKEVGCESVDYTNLAQRRVAGRLLQTHGFSLDLHRTWEYQFPRRAAIDLLTRALMLVQLLFNCVGLCESSFPMIIDFSLFSSW